MFYKLDYINIVNFSVAMNNIAFQFSNDNYVDKIDWKKTEASGALTNTDVEDWSQLGKI